MPTAGEFVHEFIGHYVALEGKLLRTLKLLMFNPGQLTLDFLAGRRVPFISPLRLYLTLSLIVFALMKVYGVELPQLTLSANSFGASYSHSVRDDSVPPQWKTATLYIDTRVTGTNLASGKKEAVDEAVAAVGNVNSAWMANLQNFMREPAARKSEILNFGFLAYLPYMLIGTLPLFALYLKLIYVRSGRRYGEHLVFALHANAFAFLLASSMIIVPGNVAWLALCIYEGVVPLISWWDCLQLIPFMWLVLYLPAALRRVYGGSWRSTCWRWLTLIAVHVVTVAILTVAAQLVGIIGQR